MEFKKKTYNPITKSNSTSKLFFNNTAQKKKSKSPLDIPEQYYLFSPKYETLHDLNRKRTGFLLSKEENKRQMIRKKSNKFSNQIDNYYYPKYHKRTWWPNGEYKIKRRYKYTGIGLDHIYENNNVEQLKTIEHEEDEKKDSDYINDFYEYNYLKKNEYIITIEHCSSCEEHQNITQHHNYTIFEELAKKYQKIIKERFPFIKVYLKPIDVENILKFKKLKLPKVSENEKLNNIKINKQLQKCRIGAFEIQIATLNDKNEKVIRMIHSKLRSKKFPHINTVLKQIVSFMPKINLKVILYDKEDYEDLEKMNNIQVNIYLCNSNLIKEMKESTYEQVSNVTSPGRRLLMLKKNRLNLQQSFFKNDISFNNNNNKTTLNSLNSLNFSPNASPIRIPSSICYKQKCINPNPNNSGSSLLKIKAINDYKMKNKIKKSFRSIEKKGNYLEKIKNSIKNNYINSNENYIKIRAKNLCQESLKSQRGALIKRKFTKIQKKSENISNEKSSGSVELIFDELPYDTYIIETIETCDFQESITLLKFNEIKIDQNEAFTKYIGLLHQKHAFLNIHLYTEKECKIPIGKTVTDNKNNNDEKKIIRPPSSYNRLKNNNEQYETILEQIPILTGNVIIAETNNLRNINKLKLNPNGIYEYKTNPGEYKIEVHNQDYEDVVMKIVLKCGLNNLNIKLKQAKMCNLTIQVLEYNECYEYNKSKSYNNYKISYLRHVNSTKEDDTDNNYNYKDNEIDEMESNMNQNVSEDNICIQPLHNAEIQIYKENNDLLDEGITDRNGIINYVVDKNDNNLYIKVNKNGYFRAERFFTRKRNMKENEKGNYECVISFILVKIERLIQLNKVLFVLYSDICKKIFELDVQKFNPHKNKFIKKDMQEENGIFLASFWYDNRPREKDEIPLDENSVEKKNTIINENINGTNYNADDYSEIINYEEIIRFGLKVSTEAFENDYGFQNIYDNEITKEKEHNLIGHLRDLCCEGNIYTPKNDFHIILPKYLSDKIITPKFMFNKIEEENNTQSNYENSNGDSNSNIITYKSFKNPKKDAGGIYWDLGWLDVKNNLFYETSTYFKIDYKPQRLTFFEMFIDFLQICLDKRICDSIYTFFEYNQSIIVENHRLLPKTIFETKMRSALDEETKNNLKDNNINNDNENQLEKRQKEINNFIQFMINILSRYDDENYIKDNYISYSLIEAKISSNLKNFKSNSFRNKYCT